MEEPSNTPVPAGSKGWIVLGVGLVLFAITFALVLKAYQHEGERRSADISESSDKTGDHLEIFAKIIAVDPVKGDMAVRLEFEPKGGLTKDEGGTITRQLKLYVNNATGEQEYVFPKGTRMNPVEVAVELYDGQVTDYPFDEHSSELTLAFESDPPPKEDDAGVPISVDLFGSVNGLKIDAQKSKDSTDDYVEIEMKVSRGQTTLFFSIFIMAVMWLLTVAVICLTFYVVTGRRKLELGMFSFLGALLFAFPALRNSQPGTPPIGTLSDFLGFFWAEVIISLCLVTLLAQWLRPQPK